MDGYSVEELKNAKKIKDKAHLHLLTNWILTSCIQVFEALLTPASIVRLLW